MCKLTLVYISRKIEADDEFRKELQNDRNAPGSSALTVKGGWLLVNNKKER